MISSKICMYIFVIFRDLVKLFEKKKKEIKAAVYRSKSEIRLYVYEISI